MPHLTCEEIRRLADKARPIMTADQVMELMRPEEAEFNKEEQDMTKQSSMMPDPEQLISVSLTHIEVGVLISHCVEEAMRKKGTQDEAFNMAISTKLFNYLKPEVPNTSDSSK